MIQIRGMHYDDEFSDSPALRPRTRKVKRTGSKVFGESDFLPSLRFQERSGEPLVVKCHEPNVLPRQARSECQVEM